MKPNASPTTGDMLEQTAEIFCAMALYGPPVVFFAAPLLLLALALMGPFALLLTLLAAIVVAAAAVAGLAALLAAPFLVLRGRRAAHAPVVHPAPSLEVRVA
jgi:hypothetical protein